MKTLPVDAEFNSLLNHMSCIERIDFLKLEEKTKSILMPTLHTYEECIKINKYEFTEPLHRDENTTARCKV